MLQPGDQHIPSYAVLTFGNIKRKLLLRKRIDLSTPPRAETFLRHFFPSVSRTISPSGPTVAQRKNP